MLVARLLDRWQLGPHNGIQWQLDVWPCLFVALFFALVQPSAALVHTAVLVAFKRLALGRLPPGAGRGHAFPALHTALVWRAAATNPAELPACCPRPAGTRLTASRWRLFRYALFSRLQHDPHLAHFRHYTQGTTIPAAVARWAERWHAPGWQAGLPPAC